MKSNRWWPSPAVSSAAWRVVCGKGSVDGHGFRALGGIGELVEAGRFWLPVDRTFPLGEIAEAHRVSEDGHVRGRLVLVVG
ncbi:MAG TPA: zinc-binding dehydrogenase [Actinomycetospora sp.]|uniref:zinc-binding dehydrogenase n=1 Tax=Actinomycetospora sp. TaxID=1872135 RepID=UPI002F3F60CD